jgi:hypothetical protein
MPFRPLALGTSTVMMSVSDPFSKSDDGIYLDGQGPFRAIAKGQQMIRIPCIFCNETFRSLNAVGRHERAYHFERLKERQADMRRLAAGMKVKEVSEPERKIRLNVKENDRTPREVTIKIFSERK